MSLPAQNPSNTSSLSIAAVTVLVFGLTSFIFGFIALLQPEQSLTTLELPYECAPAS